MGTAFPCQQPPPGRREASPFGLKEVSTNLCSYAVLRSSGAARLLPGPLGMLKNYVGRESQGATNPPARPRASPSASPPKPTSRNHDPSQAASGRPTQPKGREGKGRGKGEEGGGGQGPGLDALNFIWTHSTLRGRVLNSLLLRRPSLQRIGPTSTGLTLPELDTRGLNCTQSA